MEKKKEEKKNEDDDDENLAFNTFNLRCLQLTSVLYSLVRKQVDRYYCPDCAKA